MSSIDLALFPSYSSKLSLATSKRYLWQRSLSDRYFFYQTFIFIYPVSTILENEQSWSHKIVKTFSVTESSNITFIEQFLHILVTIANDTIPKTHSKMKRSKKKLIKKPWFTDNCKQIINQCKKPLRTLRNHRTSSNIEQFCICRAKACRTMREAKRTSLKKFVSKINSNTPSCRIRNILRKIQETILPNQSNT